MRKELVVVAVNAIIPEFVFLPLVVRRQARPLVVKVKLRLAAVVKILARPAALMKAPCSTGPVLITLILPAMTSPTGVAT